MIEQTIREKMTEEIATKLKISMVKKFEEVIEITNNYLIIYPISSISKI